MEKLLDRWAGYIRPFYFTNIIIMENKMICQSCSMPIDDPALQGTEKDGAKNKEYCKYCYQEGKFTDPDMTLDEMKGIVINQMKQRKISAGIIDLAVSALPGLKRWKK